MSNADELTSKQVDELLFNENDEGPVLGIIPNTGPSYSVTPLRLLSLSIPHDASAELV